MYTNVVFCDLALLLQLLEYKMENGDQFQQSKAKYDCLLFGKITI